MSDIQVFGEFAFIFKKIKEKISYDLIDISIQDYDILSQNGILHQTV
jgi:hypothetical protein